MKELRVTNAMRRLQIRRKDYEKTLKDVQGSKQERAYTEPGSMKK